MILRIFQIYLNVQFFLLLICDCHIYSVSCEGVTFQKTEIQIENSNVFNQNYHNTSELVNKLNLKNENFMENEQLKESDWFSNIPLLPIAIATSNSIPDGPCKRQLRLYLNHLKNGTLWAVESKNYKKNYSMYYLI